MDRSRSRPDHLPPGEVFSFSQASLQDYVDCPRRFQLRHLRQLAWPTPQAEPIQENERHVRRGERFHRLAQQALLGLPLERLAEIAAADPDPLVLSWWQRFGQLLPSLQQGQCQVELRLGTPLGRHRLAAQYDLLQLFPDEQRAVIWDWKTSLKRPRRAWLERRLQTRVYPALLARAAGWLLGGRELPAQNIQMVYWFTEFPEQPERFQASAAGIERDWLYLEGLAAEISSLRADQFPQTEDETACKFCEYRSLCDRGAAAGLVGEQEDEPSLPEVEIDFEQISEIRF